MKLNRQILPLNKPVNSEDDINYSSYDFDPNYIRGIPECHVELESTQYEDTLRVYAKVKAKVIAVCAYTMEDVELKINVEDELSFTDDPEDESQNYEPGNFIEMDDYILALILSKVPAKVVKKGAKLPENGNGYRVLTEAELAKERETKTDSRWDALDNLDLD